MVAVFEGTWYYILVTMIVLLLVLAHGHGWLGQQLVAASEVAVFVITWY